MIDKQKSPFFLCLFLAVLLLPACNGSDSSSKSLVAVEDSLKEDNILQTLDKVSEVIEDDQGFEFDLKSTGPIDYVSSARVLLRDGGAYSENTEQEVILCDQKRLKKNLFSKLTLKRIKLPSEIVETIETDFTDTQCQALREKMPGGKGSTPDESEYFLFTKNPLRIYLLKNNELTYLSDLFSESSKAIYSRSLRRLSRLNNIFCGQHDNDKANLFHYSVANSALTYFKTEREIKRLYCLENKLLIQGKDEDYYLIDKDREVFLTSRDEMGCVKTPRILTREGGVYFLCRKSLSGKQATITYRVDEVSSELIEDELSAPVQRRSPRFIVKSDNKTTRRDKEEIKIFYKPLDESIWSALSVKTSAREKRILGISLNSSNDLYYFARNALYSISNKGQVSKIPLRRNPVEVASASKDALYVLSKKGHIDLLDGTKETNSVEGQVLKNIKEIDLNPVPYFNNEEKLSVIKTQTYGANFLSFEKIAKKGQLSLYKNLTNERIKKSYPHEIKIIDISSIDGLNYLLLFNELTKKLVLEVLDSELEKITDKSLQEISYSRSLSLSAVSDGVIIADRRNVIKYNKNLSVGWKRDVFGIKSKKTLELKGKYYLSIFNNHIVLIDKKTGLFKELYKLKNVQFREVKEILLKDRTLYLNYGGSRIMFIDLPLWVIRPI